MGRAMTITVLGIAVAMSFLTMGAQEKRNTAMSNACNSFSVCSARNLSHSGANVALKKITENIAYRGTTSSNYSDGSFTASCSKVPATTTAKITSIGTYQQNTHKVEIVLELAPGGFKSAITAKPYVQTLGTLDVDGRDYDENENIIPNQGGLAILSTQTINRGGNSKYGGTTSEGIDYAPSTSFDSGLIEENAIFEGGFPGSPDAAVKVTDGMLKAIAQSGAGGSQYATDPGDITIPLRGVTYLELPDNGTWNAPNFTYCNCGFDYHSFGILVVHNANKNARLKNMRGSFYGIIIADDVDKIHGKVTGNVTIIGDYPRGNCVGNGTGDVHYSSFYISKSLKDLLNKQPVIVSWWE
ncbi:MAG: hypothetical protein JW941_09085 [Candidatus Coatesbacteria bacterium]|nr:hypothetical protein [Candidatus Coatesbacteria bacterium]